MSFISHQKRHVARAPLLINRSELVRPAPGAWQGGPGASGAMQHRLLSLACLDQDFPQR
jgi:hypothetical protein